MASAQSAKERNREPRAGGSWANLAHDLITIGASALGYFLIAIVALRLFATNEIPSAIWPATGVLVALLLVFPERLWTGILTGVFVAGTLSNFLAGKSLLLALGLGVADVFEGALSVLLLKAFIGPHITFRRLRDLGGLVIFSAAIGNGLAALAGASFFAGIAHGPFWYSWRLWWLSNAIGITALTPFVVSWFRIRNSWPTDRSLPRIAEAVSLLFVLVIVSAVIFGRTSWSSLSLPYLVFPILIWAALRFGVPGASGAAVIVAAVAVCFTVHGYGPLAVVSKNSTETLLQLQSFIAAALACSLVPAIMITAQKEGEEKLKRSELRLALAQEIAGLGSFVLNPVGQSVWSEQTYRILGRDRRTHAPSYSEFLAWVHPDDRQIVEQSYAHIFQDRLPSEIEFRYICPDGSWRYLHSVARPELDPASKSVTAFGTLLDITDRRRIEEQLRQAQKMEAVGRLAGGVAHDFNNLLGVIMGYAELAITDLKEDDPIRAKIEPISKAAARAASLTSQLLAFSRRQVLKPEQLDLNNVVKELEPMLRRLIGEGIEVVTDLQSPLPLVKADPGQMDQVLLNLAVNSRDAMPNGGRLRISISRFFCRVTPSGYSGKIPPGEYVMMTVSDTGHGMDAATLSHIFEPFFTTKEKGKGTGLGLATVYGIISQSNGHIWAESEMGKGTDIRVVLPVVKAQAELEVENSKPVAVQSRGETVLLVEDEDPLRELIVRLIRSTGCTVLEALSAEDAIRIAGERDDIDVLLTDVVMPKMDGFELARQICETRPSLKVLYMSGYSDEMISRRAQDGAHLNFIQKPFKPADLLQKLQDVIDTPRGAN